MFSGRVKKILQEISSQNKKERWEGAPCLTPLLKWKVFPLTPLRMTAKVPELKMRCIHWIRLSGNLFCSIILIIKLCSTLSKAFSKSSLRMTISLLDWWQRCRNNRDQAKQSCMHLCLMKPYWFVRIICGSSICNLLASNFVIIFTKVFNRDIGLKSYTLIALSCFGTRVIKDPL